MNKLEWQPGETGKGLVFLDGSIWTWPTDEQYGQPHHPQVLERDMDQVPQIHREHHAFYIKPNGEIYFGLLAEPTRDIIGQITTADDRLHLEPDEWDAIDINSDYHTGATQRKPWEPGTFGKGVLYDDNTHENWATSPWHDSDGSPAHAEVQDPNKPIHAWYWVDPEGNTTYTPNGTPYAGDFDQRELLAYNRLKEHGLNVERPPWVFESASLRRLLDEGISPEYDEAYKRQYEQEVARRAKAMDISPEAYERYLNFPDPDNAPWVPGFYGKGALYEDGTHDTWITAPTHETGYRPDDGFPSHFEKSDPEKPTHAYLRMNPSGRMDFNITGNPLDDDYDEREKLAIKRLKELGYPDLEIPEWQLHDDQQLFSSQGMETHKQGNHQEEEKANVGIENQAQEGTEIERSRKSELPSGGDDVFDSSHDATISDWEDEGGLLNVRDNVSKDKPKVTTQADKKREHPPRVTQDEGSSAETQDADQINKPHAQIKWYGEPGLQGDHSLLYDEAKNVIHIGDPNWHHYQLAERMGIPAHNLGGLPALWVEGNTLHADTERDAKYVDHVANSLDMFSPEEWKLSAFGTQDFATPDDPTKLNQEVTKQGNIGVAVSEFGNWDLLKRSTLSTKDGVVAQGRHSDSVSHQMLPWELGKRGKGFVLDDGTIRHWQIDNREAPHHTHILGDMGALNRADDSRYDERVQGYYQMDPDGELTMMLPSSVEEERNGATSPDPKTTQAFIDATGTHIPDWRVGRIAAQDNYPAQLPDVPDDVAIQQAPAVTTVGEPHWGESYPILYHPEAKTMYVGPKSAYHWDMISANPELQKHYPQFRETNGTDAPSEFDSPFVSGRYYDNSGKVDWFDGRPSWDNPEWNLKVPTAHRVGEVDELSTKASKNEPQPIDLNSHDSPNHKGKDSSQEHDHGSKRLHAQRIAHFAAVDYDIANKPQVTGEVKGFVHPETGLVSWPTYGGEDGAPIHMEVLQERLPHEAPTMNSPWGEQFPRAKCFRIDPDNEIEWYSFDFTPDEKQAVKDKFPDAIDRENDWQLGSVKRTGQVINSKNASNGSVKPKTALSSFAKWSQVSSDQPWSHHDWIPDTFGKGYVSRNGDLHTWSLDTEAQPDTSEKLWFESPHHADMADEMGYDWGDIKPFMIEPNGAYTWTDQLLGGYGVGGGSPSPDDELLLQEHGLQPREDEWRFGSAEFTDQINHTSGNWAKGLYYPKSGVMHTWNTAPGQQWSDEWDAEPIHSDYVQANNLPSGYRPFAIDPYGHLDLYDMYDDPDESLYDTIREKAGLDPSEWRMSAKADYYEQWQPGVRGKGLFYTDTGNVQTWSTNDRDAPHHWGMADSSLGISAAPFHIRENGEAAPLTNVHQDQFAEAIKRHNPDLYPEEDSWLYRRAASTSDQWNGGMGKGLVTPEGELHTWSLDDDNISPTHQTIMGQRGISAVRLEGRGGLGKNRPLENPSGISFFYINGNGKVAPYFSDDIRPEHEQILKQNGYSLDSDNDWVLGSNEGHGWLPNEHDYDPEQDYVLNYDQFDHPLIAQANERLQQLAQSDKTPMSPERPGRVFPADLSRLGPNPMAQDAVALYCNGTYNEPCILLDPNAHKGYEDQVPKTVDHEIAHAIQEWEGRDWDEDDAEGWYHSHTQRRFANANELVNDNYWQPGQWGKAILDQSTGLWHVWATSGEEDGHPSHQVYADSHGIDYDNFNAPAAEIHPNGRMDEYNLTPGLSQRLHNLLGLERSEWHLGANAKRSADIVNDPLEGMENKKNYQIPLIQLPDGTLYRGEDYERHVDMAQRIPVDNQTIVDSQHGYIEQLGGGEPRVQWYDSPDWDWYKDAKQAQDIPSVEQLAPHRYDRECHDIACLVQQQHPHLEWNGGFYDHPTRGPGDHAWNRAPDGTIVDMTAAQHDYQHDYDPDPRDSFDEFPIKDAPKHPEVITPDMPEYQRYISYEHDWDKAATIAHQKGEHELDPVDTCPLCNAHTSADTPDTPSIPYPPPNEQHLLSRVYTEAKSKVLGWFDHLNPYSKVSQEEQWTKGNEGKGVLDLSNGTVTTWNTSPYGYPHHTDMLGGFPEEHEVPLYIQKDGTTDYAYDTHPDFDHNQVEEWINATPGLSTGGWNISSTSKPEGKQHYAHYEKGGRPHPHSHRPKSITSPRVSGDWDSLEEPNVYDPPETMYHVTHSDNRQKIQQEGIHHEHGNSPWDLADYEVGNYLWHYPEDAEEYVHSIPGGSPGDQYDIWEVNTNGLAHSADEETYSASKISDPIPPDRIRHYNTVPVEAWENHYGSNRGPTLDRTAPPTFQEIKMRPGNEWPDKRIPVVWDGNTNTVYHGDVSGHHMPIMRATGIDPFGENTAAGNYIPPGPNGPGFSWYTVGGWGGIESAPDHVTRAIHQHFGIGKPEWHLGSHIDGTAEDGSHSLGWMPGEEGAGMIGAKGSVFTWGNDDGGNAHRDYYDSVVEEDGPYPAGVDQGYCFVIDPDGTIYYYNDSPRTATPLELQQAPINADPRLQRPSQDWKLAGTPDGTEQAGDSQSEYTPPGFKPRDPDKPWKGIRDSQNRLWTWATDPVGGPHHFRAFETIGEPFNLQACYWNHQGIAGQIPKELRETETDWHMSRTAGLTTQQRLLQAEKLPEDKSPVVHRFDDGWTVRHLQTLGDVYREGELMSNCFSPHNDQAHYVWEGIHPDDAIEMKDTPAQTEGWVSPFYSLRDEHNLPHVSIDFMNDDPAYGVHNSEPKLKYQEKLHQWNPDSFEEPDDWEDPYGGSQSQGGSRGASFRSPNGTAQDGSPAVVEHGEIPESQSWNWGTGQRPVVFDPRTNTINIGPPDRHHEEVHAAIGTDQVPGRPGEYAPEGILWHGDQDIQWLSQQTVGNDFFGHNGPLYKTVANHFGWDKPTWKLGSHFGSPAVHYMQADNNYDSDPDKSLPNPVIYVPSSNNVYVGGAGDYHEFLVRHFGLNDPGSETYRKFHDLPANPKNTYRYHGVWDKERNTLGWYDETPEQYKAVEQALGIGSNEWKLGQNNSHRLEWEPGFWGKGYVRPDGTYRTWSVDHPMDRGHLDEANAEGFYPDPAEFWRSCFSIGKDGYCPDMPKELYALDPKIHDNESWKLATSWDNWDENKFLPPCEVCGSPSTVLTDTDEGAQQYCYSCNHQTGLKMPGISWQPGNPGKGILFNNGEFHSWNVDPEDGAPHHGMYNAYNPHWKDGTKAVVEIDPKGQVGTYGHGGADPETVEEIRQQDPRLQSVNTDWRLGGWGEQDEINSFDVDEMSGRTRGTRGNPEGDTPYPRFLYHATDADPEDIEEYGLLHYPYESVEAPKGHGWDEMGTQQWADPGVYATDNFQDLGPWALENSNIYKIDTLGLSHIVEPDPNAKGAWRIRGDVHPSRLENLGWARNLEPYTPYEELGSRKNPRFSSVEKTPPGLNPRQDMTLFKGVRTRDGQLWTWQTDENGKPHHYFGYQATGEEPPYDIDSIAYWGNGWGGLGRGRIPPELRDDSVPSFNEWKMGASPEYQTEPWKPGSWGKGIYFPQENSIHAWKTDSQGVMGSPHHTFIYPDLDRSHGDASSFYIDREGNIQSVYTDRHKDIPTDILEQHGLRLPEDEDWKLGSSPITIRDDAPEADYEGSEHYTGRRAFIYRPEDNTAYVGGPGMHHDNVERHYGLSWEPRREMGVIQTEKTRGFGAGPIGVRNIGLVKYPEVYDALSDHFGLPNLAQDAEQWKFGATDPPQIINLKTPTYKGWKHRIPWVHVPEENRIYVGSPGGYHQDILDNLDDLDEDYVDFGVANDPNISGDKRWKDENWGGYDDRYGTPGEVGYYSDLSGHRGGESSILTYLANHFGKGYFPKAQDEWHLSAQEESLFDSAPYTLPPKSKSPEPPEIVDPAPYDSNNEWEDAHHDRRPLLVDIPANRIYVGPDGGTHLGIHQGLGEFPEPEGGGVTAYDFNHYGYGEMGESGIQWWDHGNDRTKVPDHIKQHVDERFGNLYAPWGEAEWHLSRVADSLPEVEELEGRWNHGMGHAFYYHPQENKIWLGNPGSYHNAIRDHIRDQGVDPLDLVPGRVDPDNITFFGENELSMTPIQKQDIKDALRNHPSIQTAEGTYDWDDPGWGNPEEDWRLGSQEENQDDWLDIEILDPEAQWVFESKTATIEPYTIKQLQMDPNERDPGDWVAARKTWLYDPEEKTFYMGDYGYHHGSLWGGVRNQYGKEPGNYLRGWTVDPDRPKAHDWQNKGGQGNIGVYRHIYPNFDWEDEWKRMQTFLTHKLQIPSYEEPQEDWKLGATEPTIKEWNYPLESNKYGPWENQRHPIVYEHDTNTVHVGEAGTHHFQLEQASGILPHYNPGYTAGFVVPRDAPVIVNDQPPGTVKWWGLPPQSVRNAVEQHFFGGPQEEEWKMGKRLFSDRKRWQEAFDSLSGDRLNQPEVEWVPIESLMPYREYDRDLHFDQDQDDPNSMAQYQRDLRDSLQSKGIQEPIFLDFDPDKQWGHISEGNHRLKILEQLGETHAPTIGYRSMRQPQGLGGAQLSQVPQPDQHNYVPQYVKPSDLGLPIR